MNDKTFWYDVETYHLVTSSQP